MATDKSFGALLADLRREHGLSVYALAQRTGLSDQTLHDLEQKDRQPSLETVRRLARAFDVTIDWIESQLSPVEMPTPTPGRPRGRPRKAAPPPAPAKGKAKKPAGRKRGEG